MDYTTPCLPTCHLAAIAMPLRKRLLKIYLRPFATFVCEVLEPNINCNR